MNFLAHCFFASANSQSVVGNLLGDFCKGLDLKALSPEVSVGLHNHRLVDKYTDSHPLIKQAKKCFSPARRRFAGVAVDVLFDHYLIVHWQRFSQQSYDEFKARTYQLLEQGQPLMPKRMAAVMSSVVNNDWFATYESLEGIGFALDRIAKRIRFENKFSGCIEDIEQHNTQLETLFLEYFPQLQLHVAKSNQADLDLLLKAKS
ncbi:MAG: acyl carrier protein phosphodiesterase [Osedax symbiont Rs2]|nr:MAG: acyl carrier protein phosphodiesterase [Osedax symbiont Rs2]